VKARHAVADIVNVNLSKIEDVGFVENAIVTAAQALNLNIVSGPVSHKFEPQGLTSIVLLSTSHISIHTYPELNLVKVDAFSCGLSCPSGAIELMAELFEGRIDNLNIIDRGEITSYDE